MWPSSLIVRILAGAAVGSGLLVSAAAAPSTGDEVKIAARVVLVTSGDAGRSDWVDFYVDGGGIASIERCERLVESELRRAHPHSTVRARTVRVCAAAPLPSPGPPAVDAQILRLEEPLALMDLFAISAPPTTGRVIRYERQLSATECERRRDYLTALAREETAQDRAKHFLDEQQRLNGEQIVKVCESTKPRKVGRRYALDNQVQRDNARARCQEAKQMGEVLAHKRREQGPVIDPVVRSCVRDGGS